MRGTVAKQLRQLTGFDPNAPRTREVPVLRWWHRRLPRFVQRFLPAPKILLVPTEQWFCRRTYREFKQLRKEADRA